VLVTGLTPEKSVLTQKESVLVYTENEIFEASFFPCPLASSTGWRNRSFSAYLDLHFWGDSSAAATRFTTAIATLKLEGPGPFRGSPDEVSQVLEEL
jgi:hypothetical protein